MNTDCPVSIQRLISAKTLPSLKVEVKAIEAVQPIHKAQLLSYIKLLDIPLGLIIDFDFDFDLRTDILFQQIDFGNFLGPLVDPKRFDFKRC